MASATTTLVNLTPALRGRKIVCKHVLFFDHGWAGYLTYLGSPTSMLAGPQLATEQNTECIHEVHAQASIFLRQLHVSNI